MHRQHDWETIGVTPNNKWSTSNTVNQTICYFQMLICLLKKVVDSSIWLPHLTALLHRRRISGGRGSADSLKMVLLHADPWKPSQTLGFFLVNLNYNIYNIYTQNKFLSITCATVGGRNPAPLYLHPETNPRTPSLTLGQFGCQIMKLNAKILHHLNDKRHPTLN